MEDDMKRSIMVIGVISLAIALTVPALAGNLRKEIGEARYDLAVQNLFNGVSSENEGLRVGSIYQLGELQAEDAVIPLMSVLRNNIDENSRLAAAWALCRIGDSRGTYAVKQAALSDQSEKVLLHSAWYYNLYVSAGTFVFKTSANSPTQIAEVR